MLDSELNIPQRPAHKIASATDRVRLALDNLRPTLIPGEASSAAYDTQLVLAESQWLERHEMEDYQLSRLKDLVRFAAREVPFFSARLAPEIIDTATDLTDALSRLPVLSREELHYQRDEFRSRALPTGHVGIGTQSTSGSTGMTVSVATTDFFVKWQQILNLRSLLWADVDFALPLAQIRALPAGIADYPSGSNKPRWEPPAQIPFPTGPAFYLNTRASLEQQWEWVKRCQPAYLDTMPSLARGFAKLGDLPIGLRRILTTGEVVDAQLRSLVRTQLGATIHDKYSSQEAGCMAIQCPNSEGYHVPSETIIVEVLNAKGQPCRPGEIGRVIATPLFNFAMPLIRYELGDFAEIGGDCSCGRHLPLLNRIMGRRRNILTAPDGRHYWPTLQSFEFFKVAQSREHQFRQVALNVLEVWLVVESPRSTAQEDEMRRIIAASLPAPFEIRFHYVAEFPRGPNGKHEEFVSLIS